MEHVVFFPAHDGTPAFRRVVGLEDAVRLVEHLRNVEGIAEVSVHALSEVPLAFKAYYRVEVPNDAAPEAPVALAVEELAPVVVEPAPAVEEVVVPAVVEDIPEQPVVALAASNGQSVGGGSKSLGFFAS